MPLASKSDEWTRLRLTRSITADSLDARLGRLSDADWRQPINLDFSAASSVDVTALQYVISMLNERGRNQLETTFSVPKTQRVRDFVRAWEFPTVASMAFGSPFRTLLWQDDRPYPAERRQPYGMDNAQGARARRSTTAYARLMGSRFFRFGAYVFNTELQVESIIEAEWSRWRSPLVLGFLDSCLRESGSEIARVVIYELLVNALRRPLADLVTIVPFVDDPEGSDTDERYLTVSVWDNGKTMIEPIRAALEARDTAEPGVPAGDKFDVISSGWTPSVKRYTAAWKPRRNAMDEELLLCSPSPERAYGWSRQQYGLSALYRCVIDLFGGSLQVRTGNQLMNLYGRSRSRRRTNRTYQADIHRIEGRQFRGNMITVRIPMNHAT